MSVPESSNGSPAELLASGFRRADVVRLVTQCLHSLGYEAQSMLPRPSIAAACTCTCTCAHVHAHACTTPPLPSPIAPQRAASELVDESGVQCWPEPVSRFRAALLHGEWGAADALITNLHLPDPARRRVRFLVHRQHYLERLEASSRATRSLSLALACSSLQPPWGFEPLKPLKDSIALGSRRRRRPRVLAGATRASGAATCRAATSRRVRCNRSRRRG